LQQALLRPFAASHRSSVGCGTRHSAADLLQEQAQRLRKQHGVEVATSSADLCSPAGIRQMVRDTEQRLGAVDILVNNAGCQHVAAVQDFPDEQWDRLIAVMLSAPFHTTKAVLPGMLEKGACCQALEIIARHDRLSGLPCSVGSIAWITAT
jgi:NAD(P)-dependent dehydrogenase (short-subunit alcohol dehydrogenase family)